jgi:ATP/maltotriose-dependent transcriptional regulator MalT
VWDDANAWTASTRGVELARQRGVISELALILSAHTSVLLFCGRVAEAAALVAETASIAEATGIGVAPYGGLHLAALRGDERLVHELAETTIREAGSRGEGVGVAISEWARALLLNATGQYETALGAVGSAVRYDEMVVQNWGLVELIEAATRIGRTEIAEEAFETLARKTQASDTNWGRGVEARSRALLSSGAMAEQAYREAIDRLGRTPLRPELARSHLVYGEWLRRESRRVDARAQLEVAHAMFSEMTASGFLERTRRELLATGATVRKRKMETRDELTAQETQIARLAANGLSNQEIGAQLFISSRTVEWHLRKVYGKLGVNARRELHGRLQRLAGV